jgi:hypothetical protein
LLAAAEHLFAEFTISVAGDSYPNFANPFKAIALLIGAVPVIALALNSFITRQVQKPCQLLVNEFREVLAYFFLYIGSDHLKKTARLITNLVDEFHSFCYADHYFRWRFSFNFKRFGQHPYKCKAIFFDLFRFHTKKITLAGSA